MKNQLTDTNTNNNNEATSTESTMETAHDEEQKHQSYSDLKFSEESSNSQSNQHVPLKVHKYVLDASDDEFSISTTYNYEHEYFKA